MEVEVGKSYIIIAYDKPTSGEFLYQISTGNSEVLKFMDYKGNHVYTTRKDVICPRSVYTDSKYLNIDDFVTNLYPDYLY